MKLGLQTRTTKRARPQASDWPVTASTRRRAASRAQTEGEVAMQREAKSRQMEAVKAHPVAELLECPPAIGLLLNRAAQCLSFEAGEVVFPQSGICPGIWWSWLPHWATDGTHTPLLRRPQVRFLCCPSRRSTRRFRAFHP